MAGPGGYFVSIFRPQQSLFFSRLKKVPKKGEHAAMQDFGAGYICFLVSLLDLIIGSLSGFSFVCRLRFWGTYTYLLFGGAIHDCLLRNHVYDLSYSTADRWLDVSFVLGFRSMGSWAFGNGNHNMDDTGYGYGTEPGWDQTGRIDCGSLIFSRARLRADDIDWDLGEMMRG
jgi:hypothetical protein